MEKAEGNAVVIEQDGEYFTATVTMEAVDGQSIGAPFKGKGTSRWPAHAVSFALEDIAKQLRALPRTP